MIYFVICAGVPVRIILWLLAACELKQEQPQCGESVRALPRWLILSR
jgi:hypothetical protein